MEAISRNLESHDWVTLLFLVGFIILALMKVFKPQLLLGYAIALFSQGFIESRADKKPSIFSVFHILIYLFTSLMCSLTLYFFANEYFKLNSFNFLLIYLGFNCYMILKYLFIRIIAKTLNIVEETRYFIFSKSGYLYTIGLWLFPLLIIYKYSDLNLVFLLIFISLLLIFRSFLITKNNKKLIFNNFFYFILYFCTLELAPLLIIYKTTTT